MEIIIVVLACLAVSMLVASPEPYAEYVQSLENFASMDIQTPAIPEAQFPRADRVRDISGTAPPTTATPSPSSM
jgi:hypothetical protein